VAAKDLHPGDTVEFGVSRISSVRVQDMQQLGYFGSGVGRVSGGRRFPSLRASWSCLRRFHRWPSSACTSLCGGGPTKI
jgi:hypothetical protein